MKLVLALILTIFGISLASQMNISSVDVRQMIVSANSSNPHVWSGTEPQLGTYGEGNITGFMFTPNKNYVGWIEYYHISYWTKFELNFDGIFYSVPQNLSDDFFSYASIDWPVAALGSLGVQFPSDKEEIRVTWYSVYTGSRDWRVDFPGRSKQPFSISFSLDLNEFRVNIDAANFSAAVNDDSLNRMTSCTNCGYNSQYSFYSPVSSEFFNRSEEFIFGVSSISAYSTLRLFNGSDNTTCNGHGKFLQSPTIERVNNNGSYERVYQYCKCEFLYNGSYCDNHYKFVPKIVQVYRAQSGSTNPKDHLEHIYDMGNANAAEARGDPAYACNTHNTDSFVVAKYTIELDGDFRDYEMFNDDECTGCAADPDKRVGYNPDWGWYSFPAESRCKPCDSVLTNNCHWRILSVDKIVRSQCLVDYATKHQSSCYSDWTEAFENCSNVISDTSAVWQKGTNAPKQCPQVISGCAGDTFPSVSTSSAFGCSHSCLQCSRRSELAFPSELEIESLQPNGVSLSWNFVNSTLYGDALLRNSSVSYLVTVSTATEQQKSYQTAIPALSLNDLVPAQKYSIQVQAKTIDQVSEASTIKFQTPGCKPLDKSLLCSALWECGHSCIPKRLGLSGVCESCFQKGTFAEALTCVGTDLQELITACGNMQSSII